MSLLGQAYPTPNQPQVPWISSVEVPREISPCPGGDSGCDRGRRTLYKGVMGLQKSQMKHHESTLLLILHFWEG